MIPDADFLRKFENDFIANDKLSYEKKLELLDAMWQEGVSLGVLPPEDPWQGLEVDIKIARILNSCSTS